MGVYLKGFYYLINGLNVHCVHSFLYATVFASRSKVKIFNITTTLTSGTHTTTYIEKTEYSQLQSYFVIKTILNT